ncbi:MAG: phosphodiester glycosidase family protein [Pseudomonadota bacterium]
MISTATRSALAACAFCAGLSAANACETIRFEETPFTVCAVDPATEDLRLWHSAADGSVLGTFDRVKDVLADEGLTLGVAMNGGMYHDDRRPVGHYVEAGVEAMRLVTSEGPGNFGLLPNGVFCIAGDAAHVIETTAFAAAAPACDFATQSGPMLVIDGALHPQFQPDSTSRFIRNGVGVQGDGTVVMAISDSAVTFHQFGRLFRDHLQTPNALYIDGNVSRLYAPALGRHDFGFPMGPILGTAVPAD